MSENHIIFDVVVGDKGLVVGYDSDEEAAGFLERLAEQFRTRGSERTIEIVSRALKELIELN